MPQRSCWQHAVHLGFLQPFASFFLLPYCPHHHDRGSQEFIIPLALLVVVPSARKKIGNLWNKRRTKTKQTKTQPKTKQKPTSFQSHSIKWKGETVAGKTAPKALSWTNWHASSFEQKKYQKQNTKSKIPKALRCSFPACSPYFPHPIYFQLRPNPLQNRHKAVQ